MQLVPEHRLSTTTIVPGAASRGRVSIEVTATSPFPHQRFGAFTASGSSARGGPSPSASTSLALRSFHVSSWKSTAVCPSTRHPPSVDAVLMPSSVASPARVGKILRPQKVPGSPR